MNVVSSTKHSTFSFPLLSWGVGLNPYTLNPLLTRKCDNEPKSKPITQSDFCFVRIRVCYVKIRLGSIYGHCYFWASRWEAGGVHFSSWCVNIQLQMHLEWLGWATNGARGWTCQIPLEIPPPKINYLPQPKSQIARHKFNTDNYSHLDLYCVIPEIRVWVCPFAGYLGGSICRGNCHDDHSAMTSKTYWQG